MTRADHPTPAFFAISVEPEHAMMRIAVHGFWTLQMMPSYLAELRRNADALLPHGGCRRILVDMSDYPIQSQTVAEGHAQIIIHGKTRMRAMTAVVMTSVLSRLQAKRMAKLAGHELFHDVADAHAWLLAQPVVD